jgi:hypothetical protein
VDTPVTLQSIFRRIADGIRAGEFRAVLFGGFALPAYGVERLTLDVDFMITDADLPAFQKGLAEVEYRMVFRSAQYARFQARSEELRDIDTVFVDGAVMDAVWRDRENHVWNGVELPVVSLPMLLATKLHALRYNAANRGSKNDLQDILELARVNQIEVTGEWFKALCEKYGTVELWTGIQRKMSGRA